MFKHSSQDESPLEFKTTILVALLAGVVSCFVTMPAMAGSWEHATSIPLTTEYDTNPKLLSSGAQGIWRARLAPAYTLTGTDGADQIKLGMALHVDRSTDKTISVDRNDPKLSAEWRRQLQTAEWGINAKYDEASTLVSELEDSGVVVTDGTRKTKSLGGDFRLGLTQRNTIASDLSYKQVSYQGGNATNYANLTGGVSLQNEWSERNQPYLRLFGGRYIPENTTRPSSLNYGVMAGTKWAVADQLQFALQAGPSWIQIENNGRSHGWQGDISGSYHWGRSDVTVGAGRLVAPNAIGGYAESDFLKAGWSYSLSEQTRASIDASWREAKTLISSTKQQFEVAVIHEISPRWDARVHWVYKHIDRAGFDEATGNLIGITLTYSPTGTR